MNMQEKIDIAEKNLERLLAHIKSVDNKCILLLGMNTAMLGILANSANSVCHWDFLKGVITIFTIFVLLTSLLLTFLGSYPQTKGPKKSLILYNTIVEKDYEKFENDFLILDAKVYIKDILKQCYRNAEILSNKYKRLKRAYCLLFIGLISWTINIYLFKSS